MTIKPEDIQKQFGAQLRKLRQDRSMSQEQLGFDAGLDRTYINSIENGKRNVSLLNIVRIAAALNVRVGELFD